MVWICCSKREAGPRLRGVPTVSSPNNPSSEKIFDKEKEQNRLKEIQMIGEIGGQMGTVLSTQGDIYATSEAKKALAAEGNSTPTRKEIEASAAYQNTMKEYGTGSDLQQAAQAVTAALQGLAGGDIGKALSGASAPYLAEVIKKTTGKNDIANVMAHAVLGAVIAEINGNSALAGAAGAASGELAAKIIAKQVYGKDPSELTEKERQNVSALGTLAGSMAGGLAGNGSGDVVAGGQAGKNAIENNSLSSIAKASEKALESCFKNATCRAGMNQIGISIGLSNSQIEEAMKAGATRDPAAIAKLSPEQIDYLDKQITSGTGMSDLILGKETWGDRLTSSNSGSGEGSNPNLGKELTNEQKTELGGTGSGTPGGWEPQDEENARNNESNKFDQFKKDDLIDAAEKPINNQGMSAAARAWEKHAGRPGGVFEPLKGNPAQKNEAASKFVNEVLNNKGTIKTDLSRGGVEYRLPDGRGIRYNSDGSFSGFLDPKRF